MLKTKLILLSVFLLFVVAVEGRAALSQGEIDYLRNDLKKTVDHSGIGSGYTHILNFFIEPDISASTYDVDDDENSQLNIYKFPLQKRYPLNDKGLDIAFRGVASYATLDMDHSILEDNIVDSQWKAYSASLGTGLFIPVAPDLTFVTAADFGLSHMKNSSNYSGMQPTDLTSILDGILYNWNTDAWIGSFVLGLDYELQFAGDYDLDIKGRYTYSHVASFNGSHEFPSFTGSAQTTSVAANFTHPLGFSLSENPFFGVAHLGATAFLGENRDALGFDSFAELGYSVKVNISQLDFFLKSLRLGYQWSVGENVTGHTILFGLDLAVF